MIAYKKKILILFLLLPLSSNLYSQCEFYKKKLDAEIRNHQQTVSDLYTEISNLEIKNGDLKADNGKNTDCSAIEGERNAWRSKANKYLRERNEWKTKYDDEVEAHKETTKKLTEAKTKLTTAIAEGDKWKKKYESKDQQLKSKDKELHDTKIKLQKTADLLNWYRMQDALNNSLTINTIDKNGDIKTKDINKKKKKMKYHKADKVIIKFDVGNSLNGTPIKYKIYRGAKLYDNDYLVLTNGEYPWDRKEKKTDKILKGRFRIELEINNPDPLTKIDRPIITITPKNDTFKLKKK